MQETIQQFNEFLVKENIDLTIVEYVIELNEKFYDIDISFINEFMELIHKDKFIIHHNMLNKYGILKVDDNIGHVTRLFEQYDFKEDVEYIKVPSHSGRETTYFLKPDIFKILLIRTKNTRKYANYYIMLEKAIYYYEKYQNMKLSKTIHENNKFKLLKLKESQTLDNFLILYDKTRNNYKYAIIRGSDKNVRETMNDLHLTNENIILKLQVPSQTNLTKRLKEVLKDNYIRQKVFYNKTSGYKYYEGEINEEPSFEDSDDWIVSINRWFNIINITIDEFLEKIKQINNERFE